MDDWKKAGHSGLQPGSQQEGYESSDARIFPVFNFIIGLGALIVVSMFLMVLLFNYLERSAASRDRPPSPLASPDQLPPTPRLDSTARGSLDEVLAEADKNLSGYRWIDKEAGIVGIPIERAMELVVERGVPSRGGLQADSANQDR